MNKQILREKYLKVRKQYIENSVESDRIIFSKIIGLKEYIESKLILTYVALEDEVDTIKLIEYSLSIGKKVAVPKCEGDIIRFYYIESLEDLKTGKFNILEPITDNLVEDYKNSICIIPGVAFDKNNNRIGYGRGFYDRFLKEYIGFKIGLCYKDCICEDINTDKYDIKMDKVITE